MKLKPADDFGPLGPAHQTGVRLRRHYAPEAELDRAQLAGALDCTDQALLVLDRFGRVCSANAATAALLGVERELLHHGYVQNYLPALDREGNLLERAMRGPKSFEVSLPDGRGARAQLTPLANEQGQPTHACIALKPAPHAADSGLEAIGRLVAELAHDINNQLSAALNYVFIVRRRASSNPQLAPHLEELQATAWRAAALTAGLKLLGPKRTSEPERLDVGELLDTLAPVLQHAAAGFQLELRHAPALPPVMLARGHVEQVLVMITLAALARARGRDSRVLAIEAAPLLGSQPAAHGVRVTWVLAAEPQAVAFPAGLPGFPGGARAPGTLKRALKRCHARLGHDGARIWIDLASAPR